ncbi:MAG: Gfo/Idh/MocA family oxidoreductase [Acidobacteriia bacterium]|nr:Gfo/Idh/MocA family oxidoreductase [Terriglobia bacterium]
MRTLLLGIAAGVVLAQAQSPLRLAIAGLNHGHVAGFLAGAARRPADLRIVGVYDPDAALLAKYGKTNQFANGILFTDLARMLDAVKPEAVAIFSDTYSHAAIVEAVAPRRIPVMMEKPLAVDRKQAQAIQAAALRYSVPVIVNYETTWYPSHGAIWNLIHEQKAAGEIRRMVAMDGHQGPREINVQPEFLAWLTDPVKNGAGALFDFGCYGANLMTWLMDNQRPLKVTAIEQTDKPAIYARVDDDATILLEYPRAQGVIQASWNWPFSRKDFEVYGADGYAIATGGDGLRVRLPGQKAEETRTPAARNPEERDSISYLIAVARGRLKPGGLSSLDNNVIVTEILDAARESARTGRTVTLR